MAKHSVSRRTLLKAGAAGTAAAALPLVNVHGQAAGGTLAIGFWDHWVPGANDTLTKIAQEWAQKNRVELKIDYITSNGNKLRLTAQAEAQARTGHDMLAFATWDVNIHQRNLEPMDDLVADLVKQYGPVNSIAEYLGRIDGKWRAVPTTVGSQLKPPHVRMDLFKQHAGLDMQAMFPGGPDGRDPAKIATWTWDAFLAAAEKLNKAGHPFGLPLGSFSDAIDWVGALFRSFNAVLVTDKGDIVVRTDPGTKAALEYMKRLCQHLPADVFAWDDASNNRAYIAGRASLILNPPSAWAVAKRDAPQIAEQTWYIQMPKGPAGRFVGDLRYFHGVWGFSRQKNAAKDLIRHISQRENAERLVAASLGYDLPPFASQFDFATWREEGPPKGLLYNYTPRDDTQPNISGYPSEKSIAAQMYNQATFTNMIARLVQRNEAMDSVLSWAQNELEGFQRG